MDGKCFEIGPVCAYSFFEPVFRAARPRGELLQQETDNAIDNGLIARIAQGNRQAMDEFYRRHVAKVYRFTLRHLRSEAAAEDVTNDVFIDVWNQAGRFEGRSRVATWLLGIARYKALSAHRRSTRQDDGDHDFDTIEDDADTPEIAAQKTDKAAALKRCIAALSPAHREIVELVYYQEMSIRDAAEILEIPENTVKTRMYHARENLSRLCAKAGIERGWP